MTSMPPPFAFSRTLGPVLSVGFGIAVAMWAVGYVCRLPGAGVPPWVLLALFLLCLFGGGWLAARLGHQTVRNGLLGGLVAGLVNLLILGSLLSGVNPNQIVPSALWWIPGSLLIAMLLTAAGAAAGRAPRQASEHAVNWRATFATVTVCATLLLLSLGGIVTGYEAGMAVPDWPNSYGYNMFLYPLSRMTGGIYYEHAHRLFGSLVGLTTLTLASYLFCAEKRGWLRALGVVALATVIVQGILGGKRVTLSAIQLAIFHGVLAQIFFSLLVAIRVFTATTWQTAPPPMPRATAGTERTLCLTLVAVLIAQLILGALQRHVAWGLHLHITLAAVVLLLALAIGVRAWGFYDGVPLIPRLGVLLLWLIGLQLALGISALVVTSLRTPEQPPTGLEFAVESVPRIGLQLLPGVGPLVVIGLRKLAPTGLEVAVTTAHQTTGALLLACSVALVLWNYRLLKPAAAMQPASVAGLPSGSPTPTP